jgi:hypothetical protein
MIAFLKSLFSGEPGVSFGRVMSFLVGIFILTWDSVGVWFAINWNLHHLPPGAALVPLFPTTPVLLGQAAFASAFFAITKAAALLPVPKGDTAS